MPGSVTFGPRGGSIWTAIIGGIIGSALTAGILLYAAPQYVAKRIVRQGMVEGRRTGDTLRHRNARSSAPRELRG